MIGYILFIGIVSCCIAYSMKQAHEDKDDDTV